MQLNEYQAEAIRTKQDNADTLYLAGKLASESAGEVLQPILKHIYHGAYLDVDGVIEEVGDCLWYVATLADAMGVTLEELAQQNIDKLRQRHGHTYRAEHYTGEEARQHRQSLKYPVLSAEEARRQGERGEAAT